MKTSIKKIVAAIVLLIVGTALNAGTGIGERSIKVSTEKSKAVVLRMDNLGKGTAVSLKDGEGNLLFKEQAGESTYGKVLNLKSLEMGDLYLEIENDEQLEILTIKVTDTQAYLEKSAQVLIEKPIVKVKGDMAKVFFGAQDSETKVTLFDAHRDIAYRHTVKGAGAKSYDLSDLAAGNYQFQFKTGGKTFYHSITLK